MSITDPTRPTALPPLDDDEFNEDMTHLRGLAILVDALTVWPAKVPPSVETDIDIYLEPWPRDIAADMLTAWQLAYGPASLASGQA